MYSRNKNKQVVPQLANLDGERLERASSWWTATHTICWPNGLIRKHSNNKT